MTPYLINHFKRRVASKRETTQNFDKKSFVNLIKLLHWNLTNYIFHSLQSHLIYYPIHNFQYTLNFFIFKLKFPYLLWNPFVQSIDPFQPLFRVPRPLPWPNIFILSPGGVIQAWMDGGEGGRKLVRIDVGACGPGSALKDRRFAVEVVPMGRVEGPRRAMTRTRAGACGVMAL